MAETPLPGRPSRTTRTGRPLPALLDLLGRRWCLRVLWELRDGDPLTFRELRDRCDTMSPSVLNDRLRELREAAFVTSGPDGYVLTSQGRDLLAALAPLGAFAEGWTAS
ncbi:winged helix-turn-helix transcriptional regulator [Nocardioides speluncae]|uniref:winged helix-turn-helix transcriptional regulator n=1 Tax=Nocardioides speluncae TaxID=2670337 RepID=UPI000D6967CA|nr:winged helix-turn-helix transcriptional regulator [Nocardioides speluncae]